MSVDDLLTNEEAQRVAADVAAVFERRPKPHWVQDGDIYSLAYDRRTTQTMEPGMYDIGVSQQVGIYFSRVDLRDDELIQFPDTAQDRIAEDIVRFWDREPLFGAHDIPFKRGILLYGPPGSGKSCTLQLVGRDVVKRGGIILQFADPDVFVEGYRTFRKAQPDTPLVVIMEDIDTLLERKNESKILNLLDGAEVANKVVFLATTNYPEKLGPRIMNRPSRFDRVYKVPHPSEPSRLMYLERIAKGMPLDLTRWAKDTNGLSLAHLKELFVGVALLGDDYKETLDTLKEMRRRRVSAEDEEEFTPGIGFGGQYA